MLLASSLCEVSSRACFGQGYFELTTLLFLLVQRAVGVSASTKEQQRPKEGATTMTPRTSVPVVNVIIVRSCTLSESLRRSLLPKKMISLVAERRVDSKDEQQRTHRCLSMPFSVLASS